MSATSCAVNLLLGCARTKQAIAAMNWQNVWAESLDSVAAAMDFSENLDCLGIVEPSSPPLYISPILNATPNEIEKATADLRAELDIANNDLETISQNLVAVESKLADSESKVADLERVISELRAELKVSGEFLATANNELERLRTEQARSSYREEEYQKALVAAAEARERAAMLAGRIEGIESQQKMQVPSPQAQDSTVVGKKKAPSKK